MCGIIGYLGPKPVVPILLDGLRCLEYRGYDSAGIALAQPESIEVRRSAGKLSHLVDAINDNPLDGAYGIGHTRWATHGRATADNAHPHRDCSGRTVLVHNGIIENYLELKRELSGEGHHFATETDSEVMAHLVERESNGDGLEHAVLRALRPVQGIYGMVFMSANDPGKIVAVREGPPIVVGVGDGEFLVASDVAPILPYTRDVIFLEDGEMAVIRRDHLSFLDRRGRTLSKAPARVDWDPAMVQKGAYRHYMLKEIFEQPLAVRQTLSGNSSADGSRVTLKDARVRTRLQEANRVQIVACGTSWHAGLVGKFLIERLAHLPVDVDYASEYRYRQPVSDKGTLAVAITQSGETADTLAALREAKERGATTLAICNVVGSMATREADGTLHTHAGPEIGVASTKAFTSQLVAMNLLALHLAELKGTLTPAAIAKKIGALKDVPRLVQQVLERDSDILGIAKRHYKRNGFLFLGRGVNYPIALEGALKLKEISYIHAEGYPAGEMKHGPIALIDDTVPVVAIATEDLFAKVASNIQEVKARGAAVVVITDVEPEHLGGMLDPSQDSVVQIPKADPFLTPLLSVIPLQLLAYHIASLRGCDVDQPRNLAKSVTVE
jgi:glucosamine--fructose-6-phosphate aminotransferase (isomerizing)